MGDITLSDYQKRTGETAVYPKGKEVEYLALGLVNEIGEALEKIHAIGHIREVGDEDKRAAVVSEVGDCFWYLSQLFNFFGFSLSEAKNYFDDVFPDFANKKILSSLHADMELSYSFIPAAAFQGLIKKYIRDNKTFEELKESSEDRLSAIAIKLFIVCCYIGATPYEVCYANYKKLQDRKDRGVIKGSGDNR